MFSLGAYSDSAFGHSDFTAGSSYINSAQQSGGAAGLAASAAGVALPYADGSFGITSKGDFRFYQNNWRGNQYITTRLTHAADIARPLGPVGFALGTFGDVSSVRNGDISSSIATINILGGAIGLFIPAVGIATGINSVFGGDIGAAAIGTAINAGPQPVLVPPNSGLELQRALEYAFE